MKKEYCKKHFTHYPTGFKCSVCEWEEKRMKINYSVVIPARNEEEYIFQVLFSLYYQTIPPKYVCILNDGSIDTTHQKCIEFLKYLKKNTSKQTFKMDIITISKHQSLLGTISLAKIFNLGFKKCEKENTDFVMILGGDTILKNDYSEILLKNFKQNKKLLIASGKTKGITFSKDHISGSGRMFRSSFFKIFNYGYPVISAWESSPLPYAKMYGGEYKTINEAICYHDRIPTGRMKSAVYLGMGMRSMGYWVPYAMGRILIYFLWKKRNLKQAIQVFVGFLSFQTIHGEKKLKKYVKQYQIQKLRNKLWI